MFICIKSIIVLCKNKKENKLILFYSILFILRSLSRVIDTCYCISISVVSDRIKNL
jgi:hypothetical protein